MARGIRELRRRIQSVRNMEQITKAMKMVAASKLRKAENTLLAARPYTDKVFEVVSRVTNQVKDGNHPLLAKSEGGKTGIVLITGDRGLAGAFNGNLIRRASDEYKAAKDHGGAELILLGRKGRDFFRRTAVPISAEYTNLGDVASYAIAIEVARLITAAYQEGRWTEVKVIYARHRSAINYDVVATTALPFTAPAGNQTEENDGARADYIFEPSAEAVLGQLLPNYLETVVYRAMMESRASEEGARMAAMDSASRNAGDMIKRLTLFMNRVRQSGITSELAEIVGGVEAMRG